MYQANIPTLLLILAVNKLLLGALVFYLKKSVPNTKGINYWAFGSVLTAIGLFVYSITPYPATAIESFFYSVAIHFFVYTGDVIFLAGFWVFFDKPIKKFVFLVPLINITIATIFTLGIESVWMRFSFTNFVGFMLYAYSAYEIRKLSENARAKQLLRWSSNIYFFYAFMQLLRFFIGVILRPDNPTGDSVVSIFLFAFAGLTFILLTFSIVVLIVAKVNEKLEDEISNKNMLHSIIAHDLKNSLNNIGNNITMLKKNIRQKEDEVLNKSVKSLTNASLSSRFLLENLFHWSQNQLKEIEVSPRKCDIRQMLEACINTNKPLAEEKNITIDFARTNSFYALCDENMINIVFRNIISNAVKFTEPNGQITISVAETNSTVDISITDNGLGLTEEKLKEILDGSVQQSMQGTNNEKGYGFGLLLSRRFIQLNNAKLTILSKQGVGSTFIIALPNGN